MCGSSDDSEADVSEDEYEVDDTLQWYMYSIENETWEPEENLTKYGSARLVDRFWKEWPKKSRSNPEVGTRYSASRELLAEERKRFLANRPKNEPVKGVDRPKKPSKKPILIGDPETDDEDILAPTEDEEDDEDILQSSSQEDAPINKVSRTKPARTSSSAGTRPKVLLKVANSTRKQPMVPPKPAPSRPSVSHPATPTSSAPATRPRPPPTAKATKVVKKTVVRSKQGQKSVREVVPARPISKDSSGIKTKGKQVERTGKIITLGRRGSGSVAPTLVPGSAIAYPGVSMRKAGQGSGSDAPNALAGTGAKRIGSAMLVDSPVEMSPVNIMQRRELPATQLIDDFVNSVQAEIQPELQSPHDLFDGPSDEGQSEPQIGLDLDLGGLAVNSPPQVPEPLLPSEPQSEPQPGPPPPPTSAPPPAPPLAQPTVPTDIPLAPSNPDHLPHPCTPSPSVQSLALQSPVPAIAPLLPGQWHWTGDLFVTTPELAAGTDADIDVDEKAKPKPTHHRVCEVVIRDPVLTSENGTRVFTSTLGLYVKGQITIQNTSDLHILYAEIAAGAFELTQAAWMLRTDTSESADPDLWRGMLRKMETTIQGTIIKIYNASNAQMTRHLLLVPCTLVRKFRRLQAFAPVVEYFRTRTEGFAVLMCRRVQNMVEPGPRPLLAQQLPKHWQQIPPELHDQLRGVKCLVFPSTDSEPESSWLHAELAKCDAVTLDGFDRGGHADAIFVHRAWARQLSGLLGLTHRRKRLHRRFYAFGSGGLWSASEWDVREIWLIGGMVTFTPAALLEDPWVVNKVVETIQSNPTWHAYIEPQVVGTLTLSETDDEVTFVLERTLDEIAFSNDFVPYPLALTSPPPRGFTEEFEWVHAQYTRLDKTSEELRKSCEEEAINAYKKEIQGAPKTTQEAAPKARPKGSEANSRGRNGNPGGWGSPGSNTPLRPDDELPAPQVDLSQIASGKRIGKMSDAVIEGLKTMQIQPCFMREIRQFMVIDSKARAKEKEVYKTEEHVQSLSLENTKSMIVVRNLEIEHKPTAPGAQELTFVGHEIHARVRGASRECPKYRK
ncbi:hypothetical protein FRC10_007549 [Ceratobasidium sp. 414]|nr:hypothetical protein FRC10_007549 [Ceratobasidium sp. 414]